jgi:hypothetical protein
VAFLRKRNDKWQAHVRRTDHDPRCKHFQTRTDVPGWMRQTEQEPDRVGLPMRGYNQGKDHGTSSAYA